MSVCEKLLVTANGPHPTLALPLVVEVWKWDWMSDVSPSISKTTFAARRKAVWDENASGGEGILVVSKGGGTAKILLTCGVHREKVVFGQLCFAVKFGVFVTDRVRVGVH